MKTVYSEQKNAFEVAKYLNILNEYGKSEVKDKIDKDIKYLEMCVENGIKMDELRIKKIMALVHEAGMNIK